MCNIMCIIYNIYIYIYLYIYNTSMIIYVQVKYSLCSIDLQVDGPMAGGRSTPPTNLVATPYFAPSDLLYQKCDYFNLFYKLSKT